MISRLSALLVWGLVAGSAVFWALRLSAPSLPVPPGAGLASGTALNVGDLSRLLGASAAPQVETAAAPPPAANRFRLTGVVATRSGRGPDAPGIALISVDGSPPRAYRVGDPVDSQLSLVSVALRSASIGNRSVPGAVDFVLELPPPSPPATGKLGAAPGLAAASPAPAAPMAYGQAAAQAPMPAPLAAGQGMPGQGMAGQVDSGSAVQKPMPRLPVPGMRPQGLPPGAQFPADGVAPVRPMTEERARTLRQ